MSDNPADIFEAAALEFWNRYQKSGEREELDLAISYYRSAVDQSPKGRPDHARPLDGLGVALSARYQRWGAREDLEKAILYHRSALLLLPEEHTLRPVVLNNYGNSLYGRFKLIGHVQDLEIAIASHRAVLKLLPEHHPKRPISSASLAACLRARFRQYRKTADLEESIALNRTVLALRPEEPLYSSTLNNLAVTLSIQFLEGGREEDLEEAIAILRSAPILDSDAHDQPVSLANLADCLLIRFEHRGRMEDLDEAIALSRSAVTLLPDCHPGRTVALMNLASSLVVRCNQGRRGEDLDESISIYRAVLALVPKGHPDHSATMNDLGRCLHILFNRTGRAEHLDESIFLHHTALKSCPAGHPFHPYSLYNLADVLCTRFEKDGRVEDLNEAIFLHRRALIHRPERHPERCSSLFSLAETLYVRYRRDSCIEDLEESISLVRAAVKQTPEGRPKRCRYVHNLATFLYARFERDRHVGDFEEAIQLLESASGDSFSSLLSRLHATQIWTALARKHDHSSALLAYQSAISLLERALTIRPTLEMQHDLLVDLQEYKSIVCEAASYAIEKGMPDQAIELLEQGRGLLWAQLRGFRTPLEQLAEVNEALVARFQNVNRHLEHLAMSSETLSSTAKVANSRPDIREKCRQSFDGMMRLKQHLLSEQGVIIDEIRKVPGFEDFLKPTPFMTLKEAADEGPVIVINHCRYRSDVLILSGCAGGEIECLCVPLDGEFYADSSRLYDELLRTRKEFKASSPVYDVKLREVMKMLWDRVVSRIVVKLKELGVYEGSRIWWCPTSVLTALPFHAAGPFSDAGGGESYLMDDYVSSYTPTLKSLINARSGVTKGKMKLLVVSDTRLPSARREIEAIRDFGIGAEYVVGDQATRESTIKSLQKTRWVHFACHGHTNPRPFDSSFELFDDRLTLLDIAKAHLPRAEFAFLSACHTAEEAPNGTQDEVLHLAAAMQFCGFRSVIGTMWELFDGDGPMFAKEVYAHLCEKLEKGEVRFKRAAAALRSAALNLRGQGGIHAERWVNMVHIGA